MDNSRIISPGWMLKQDNMALINQCRKYIQMEFGTRLLFSQPDLIERIREYSSHSQNRKLLDVIKDLEQRLESGHHETTPSNVSTQRVYRGQAMTAADTTPAPATASPSRTPRIYRGQLLTD